MSTVILGASDTSRGEGIIFATYVISAEPVFGAFLTNLEPTMFCRSIVSGIAVLTLLGSALTTAEAQRRIFVNNDEYALSSGGITQVGAASVTNFTRNVTSWLTGSLGGNVLIASNNFGFPLATISSDLSSGGYSFVTTQNNTALGWANRNSFQAIFLDASTVGPGSNAQLQLDLQNYVLGGGSVYLNFGTGTGSAAQEAANYQNFLNYFGLQIANVNYNSNIGVINTSSYAAQGPYGAALFGGVSSIYVNRGNDVTQGGANTAGYNRQIFGGTLFGAAAPVSVVPEPSTYALMIAGLAGLGIAARRRRS